MLDGELKHRSLIGNHGNDGFIALFASQVAGVEAVGANSNESLRVEFARVVVGAHRSFLPSRIRVESENDFGCRVDRCRKHAVQSFDVVITEGRATGCDGCGHSGKVAGHHIGVALDYHNLLVF